MVQEETKLCPGCRSQMRVQRERRHSDVVEVLYGCDACACARIVKRSEGLALANN